MSAGCVFCKIIAGEIQSPRVHEDDNAIVIRDLHPQARVHLLVIPKRHVTHLDELHLQKDGTALAGSLLGLTAMVARSEGLMPGGYRVVTNANANGGQSVYHLHFHLLGGEQLSGGFGV